MEIEYDGRQAQKITTTRGDDWHLHLREGEAMRSVVWRSAKVFGRAIVMPNLKPPVTTVQQAAAYRESILNALHGWQLSRSRAKAFPLMTLYLTDATRPDEIRRAKESGESGFIHGVKYYPAGATTNSEDGVRDLEKVTAVLRAMEEVDLPLLLHGEVADPNESVFRREETFVFRYLEWLYTTFPRLRIVLEHVTTARAVEAVKRAPPTVAATITAHHLLYWHNHLLDGLWTDGEGQRQRGLLPHLYCKPILKGRYDRESLVEAATSGNPKFFLGTDSAPHAIHAKEAACGCAGCFSAPVAMSLYAKAFEAAGKLGMLEGFASHFGADFYRLPRNTDTITLVRRPWVVPRSYAFGEAQVIPLCAGETLEWQVVEA